MSKQITPQASDAAAAAGGRMAGEERRLQILRVAVRLFSRRGFRGTTTKEIAHEAGVSEAIIFRHFATKEELYAAILDHKACTDCLGDPRELVADAVRRRDDRAVFETLASTALEHHENDQEFLRLLLHSALDGHELAQMFWDRNVLPMYDFLSTYIAERQREGAFREANPRTIVRAFLGMLIHHALNNNLWDPERRLLDISNEEAAREFTEILLAGIKSQPGEDASLGKSAVVASSNRTATKKKQAK